MTNFVTKSERIEALQWTGKNWNEICEFCPKAYTYGAVNPVVAIDVEKGTDRARIGDWVVKASKGFCIMTNEELEKNFEEVK